MSQDNPEASSGGKSGMTGRILIIVGIAVFVLALAGAGAGYLGYRHYQAPGPTAGGEPTIVQLRSGMGGAAIAGELKEAGVIRHVWAFRAAAKLSGAESALKAGEYEIPPGASLKEIIDILTSGKSILYPLTIPEGLTTNQILRLVGEAPHLEGELTETPGEGELLPETYMYSRGETRDAIVRRMAVAQTSLLDEIWSDRALELPFDTREEAVILASVVEKETGLAAERPRVAAVFVNRMRRNMRLESDPTIIYGLTGGEPLGRGLRRSELDRVTPYNTYKVDGLPPTPIANPGRASIEAVLNPPETDDLYFVADGEGGHVFATNYRDHQRNVAAWRRIERSRNAD